MLQMKVDYQHLSHNLSTDSDVGKLKTYPLSIRLLELSVRLSESASVVGSVLLPKSRLLYVFTECAAKEGWRASELPDIANSKLFDWCVCSPNVLQTN